MKKLTKAQKAKLAEHKKHHSVKHKKWLVDEIKFIIFYSLRVKQ